MENKSFSGNVFSGIQPTGTIHIGNYLGAIKNWIDLQNTANTHCIFTVVDLHAITIPYNPADFHKTTLSTFAILLACGLDPEKVTLFIQSHVNEHTSLAWLLASVTPYGDLTRMTQFKDKSEKFNQNINAGLFTYPVLMAADILLYNAEHIPVGQDQLQHLELAREIARRFNERFNTNLFTLPKPLFTKTLKLKGLDGEAKMSKSLNNYIGLTETKEELMTKIRGAKTDPQRVLRTDAGDPNICNIFDLHQKFSTPQQQQEIRQGCITASIGCMDCKKCLIENLWTFIEPIKIKKEELEANPKYLNEIIHLGKNKAKKIAVTNLQKVYDIMGF